MNNKPNSNSSVIWSPNNDNIFIKVYSKQIELYEIKSGHPDENLSLCTKTKKLDTLTELEVIKSVSWQAQKPDQNISNLDHFIAIAFANGVIRFTNLIQNSSGTYEFNFTEREFKPKILKPSLLIYWNPFVWNMLAQVIDKTKGPTINEPAILIWEFPKLGSNKVFNQVSKFIQQLPSNTNHNKIINDMGVDQPNYEYCRGDVVTSFAWINPSQFICGVNNKCLKIFELRSQNHLKVVNTDATCNLSIDINHSNLISSFVDDKIFIWKEENLDKPVLSYVEDGIVENLEWSPIRQGYLSVTLRDKPYLRVLDTRSALINESHEIEHTLIDRCIKSISDTNIMFATWHRQIQNCILLLLADDNVELVYLRTRRCFAWSPEQKFVCTNGTDLTICSSRPDSFTDSNLSEKHSEHNSKAGLDRMDNFSNDGDNTNIGLAKINWLHFLETDISFIMLERAENGYGLKFQLKDGPYSSMFNNNNNGELKTFWSWIESASNNYTNYSAEMFGGKSKSNPFNGAIDGISDIATVTINRSSSEIHFQLNTVVSHPEEVRWNQIYDVLPFPKYVHPFRTKIFTSCGWPFDQPIEKWRYILESLENKERSAAMALVTLNFDVALQYLKRIPNDKGLDNEILRLCLAGFNTQSGQANNTNWATICKDVLKRLGNSRPYLRLIFNFLIAKNKADLQFIKSLNILLVDKLVIAALYMDDETLVDFFNIIGNCYLKNGHLEMVAMTGLKSREFIDLMQAYVNRSGDVQTAANAILQANILTRNSIEKSKRVISWVESYRNLLDRRLMWLMRADFDIANQYVFFQSGKEVSKITKPQQMVVSKSSLVNLNSISNSNQVYIACGFCGWKISQPSKYATNMNRNSIQNKTRPDGSMYGNSAIQNIAIHAGGCKATICQHCRKPLPRCSVCLMNMGINGDISTASQGPQMSLGIYSQKDDQLPSNPIENWFMWCQRCKHGGHTGHLQQWFQEWNECPVSGCKCTCSDLDNSYSLFNTHSGQKNEKNNLDL